MNKVGETTIKTVDGILNKDSEAAYQEFALKWFEDNEDAMKKEGRVIPPGASDEWKINMALSSKEKGGMGAAFGIKDPKYQEIRERMDKIGVLRADMKKDQIPPETPFLVLNYLQESADKKQKELDRLEIGVRGGDEAANIMVESKRNELEKLNSTMRELAAKTMNEDLKGNAEKAVKEGYPHLAEFKEYPSQQDYVKANMKKPSQCESPKYL